MPSTIQRTLLLLALALCCDLACASSASNGAPEPAMCPQLYLPGDQPADGPDTGPVVLTADHVELEKDGLSKLLGSALLKQGGKEFSANALTYDDKQRLIKINTESLFRTHELVIRSQQADFDLNAESGAFSNTQFTLPVRAGRGSADQIKLFKSGTADIQNANYTTCAPGSDAWYVKAGKIHFDYASGVGTATNARLLLDNVPVFYMPYFRFPLDNLRHTGLLFPTLGQSVNNGLDLRIPLYLNLAPNYDATLTPRYMSKRGIQLGTAFRYLFTHNEGDLDFQYLKHDQSTGITRRLFSYNHEGLINHRLAAKISFTDVSDPDYFNDFSSTNLDASTLSYLDRSASLTYQAPTVYSITGLLQDYQTLSTTILSADQPYRRLPQIRFVALSPQSLYNTHAGFTGEYDNFVRPNSVDGQRIDLDPYLRFARDDINWFSSSQLDFRYTGYQLSDAAPGQSKRPSRALPEFSASGGLRFDRMTDSGNLQTLEPQIGYLYVPYRDQSSLPVFDSGLADFDNTQLFERNRYYGGDRISDANHATFALGSRLMNPETGTVWLSSSLGEIYRFSAPRVTLPGEPAPSNGATDFVGTLDYVISRHWATSSDLQWSPETHDFSRTEFALHYLDGERRADLAYHYRRGLLEQTDFIASTPIYGAWKLAGRWRYSLANNQTVDTLAGVEYDTCCWALRTSYRRYIANASGKRDSGIYMQLELKGLSRIGTGFEGLLPPEQPLPPR
ncbi:MAG: LPS-assembly protein LptD [Stenotrophobium sp.]